jgi:hypothetical protein
MPRGHPTTMPLPGRTGGNKRYAATAAREMTVYVVQVPIVGAAPELAAARGRVCGREFRTPGPTAAFNYRMRIPLVETHPTPAAAIEAYVKQCREMAEFHARNQQVFNRRAELAARLTQGIES